MSANTVSWRSFTKSALGLDHPGEYNGGSPTYANDALYAQDTHMWTVMSYFDAQNTGADWYAGNGWWHYAQTPMLHDLLAAQAIYGADMSTRSGDTVYGFNSTADRSVFDFTQNDDPVVTIWDGGGTDTLDFSGWNSNSQISLVEGTFSHVNSMTHNVAIAFGAQIENATGGGGNDQITGNALDNVLKGLGGNDVIDGAAGDDWLEGGAGFDTLLGGAGNDTIIFDGADNLGALDGGSGTDLLVVNGGSVPALDLAAHGFELADHVVTDGGGANWSQYTDHYNASWARIAQDGTFDAGGRWRSQWDVADVFSWSEQTNTYNAANQRYEQTGTYDNGRTWQIQWDVAGTEAWAHQTSHQDAGGVYNWVEFTQFHDDLGQRYEQSGTFDTGRAWHILWDAANTQVWSQQSRYQDLSDLEDWTEHTVFYDDFQRRYEQFGTYDTGRAWHTLWDVADTEAWSQRSSYQDLSNQNNWIEHTEYFDELGRRYEQTGTYDTGRTWHKQWDVSDVQAWSQQTHYQDLGDIYAWSEHTQFYDDLLRLYEQTGTYDTGRTWHKQWDVADVEVWSQQTHYQDLGNIYTWTEHTQFYDDLGRLYDQTGTYDTGYTWHKQWDVADVEIWSQQTHYQDLGDIYTWSEHTKYYDDLGRLYDQTGTYDTGYTWHKQWDVAGVELWSQRSHYQDLGDIFDWSEHTQFHDDLGRLYEQTGTYDTGRTWHKQWDVADVEVWSQQSHYQDLGDVFDWSEQTQFHDDLGRLYEQTGTKDDGQTWQTSYDLDNTEVWYKRTHLIDADDAYSWAEQILEYDESSNIIHATVIDDAIA
jgi:hypothetical protein